MSASFLFEHTMASSPGAFLARRQHFLAWTLIILLPLVLNAAVTAFWVTTHKNLLTGDEPHYLLTADSIAGDGDVLVTNNYLQDTAVSAVLRKHLNPDNRDHVVNGSSVHGIGFPLLLALPYLLAGVAGAKFFLASAIGVVFPILTYQILTEIVGSRRWAALGTLTFVCTLPFLAGSNQIYSDWIAGVLVLHAASILIRASGPSKLTVAKMMALATEIAFLPWLYKRYIPAALVLLACMLWVTIRARDAVGRPRILALSCTIIGASFVSLGIYQYLAFGNPLGYFARDQIQYDPRRVLMILAGLHWDSFEGLFFQNPFLWVALLGVVPFARVNPRGASICGGTYLAIILPGAMNSAWYGGAAFAGRYFWAGMGLWAFPLGYALKAILSRKFGALVVVLISGASWMLQIALARIWVTHYLLLYNHAVNHPLWAIGDWYTWLFNLNLRAHSVLPSFRNFEAYASHLSNYLVATWSALVLASGIWFHAGRTSKRALGAASLGFILIAGACLFFSAPQYTPWVLAAANIPGQIGKNEGSRRIAVPGGAGNLIAGPLFFPFPGQTYEFVLNYETGAKSTARYAVDYRADASRKGRLPPSTTNNGKFRFQFTVSANRDLVLDNMEFRVRYLGRGRLVVDQLEIVPVNLPEQ